MHGAAESGPVWLVLPTYNEVANVRPFVEAVAANLPAGSRILIVDDASPDGTGQIAEAMAAERDDLEVVHRPRKEGLGPAYVEGFRQALEGGAGRIVQMDSDFSHDPAYLPRVLAAAQRADLVIGSRYVSGGGIRQWSALRRAVSRGGSAYARFTLGVGIRDLTSGFKCFRRDALEAIDPETLRSRGYAFQVETTYRALRGGMRVDEVPIVFRDRDAGASKMGGAIVLEAAWRTPLLRLRGDRYGKPLE